MKTNTWHLYSILMSLVIATNGFCQNTTAMTIDEARETVTQTGDGGLLARRACDYAVQANNVEILIRALTNPNIGVKSYAVRSVKGFSGQELLRFSIALLSNSVWESPNKKIGEIIVIQERLDGDSRKLVGEILGRDLSGTSCFDQNTRSLLLAELRKIDSNASSDTPNNPERKHVGNSANTKMEPAPSTSPSQLASDKTGVTTPPQNIAPQQAQPARTTTQVANESAPVRWTWLWVGGAVAVLAALIILIRRLW